MNHPSIALAAALAVAAFLVAPPTAHADDEVASYAIVVGANAGGSGQGALRFAEDDAARVAAVLRELGGYDADDIVTVLGPTPEELLAAIDAIGARVATDAAAGRQSKVFFYYSGHAKASGLDLGDRELPLTDLRERLLSLPSTLTVVVLDACQSGAFSRIKGAEPAADFSFNSVAKLDAAGVAVLASSSASELSQESDSLGSSYFTHHFLVGLRGAGDSNGDARVSLDEAYRWAYTQTLVSTAATAVGSQHVTLEVDLKGKGEVPLTYTRASDAQLELPTALEAQVIVHTARPVAVVAEVHKSSGAPVRLALPSGDYQVLVRAGGATRRCDVVLRGGAITSFIADDCAVVPEESAVSKGGDAQERPGVALARYGAIGPSWAFDVSAGIGLAVRDEYTDRLEAFGYRDTAFLSSRVALTASKQVLFVPTVFSAHLLGELGFTTGDAWLRDGADGGIDTGWSTTSLALGIRLEAKLARLPWLVPYAQFTVGGALVSSHLRNPASDVDDRSSDLVLSTSLGGGLRVQPWRHLGFYVQVERTMTDGFENLFGDQHDTGGRFVSPGIHLSF